MSNITITLNINAPELSSAIQALAVALTGAKTGNVKPTAGSTPRPEAMRPEPEPVPEPAPKREQQSQEPQSAISLEEVRAKLAALSQSGKQAEVKALIKKFGASKLTEIPPERYVDLLAEAEAI